MRKITKLIFSLVLVFAIVLSSSFIGFAANGKPFYAHFAKIGQEDSILLEQNSNFVLVDTGRYYSKDTINSLLDARGVTYLNSIIITHYDADHIGALLPVLEHIDNNVGTLYGRYYDYSQLNLMYTLDKDGVYKNYLKFVNAVIKIAGLSNEYDEFDLNNVPAFSQTVMDKISAVYSYSGTSWLSPNVSSGDNFYFGSSYITWMNPAATYFSSSETAATLANKINADSLVFRVGTESGNKMLFLGDTHELSDLVNATNTDCDVLKISHHGYPGSTTEKLLDEATPAYSIMTVADGSTATSRLNSIIARTDDIQRANFGSLYYTGTVANSYGTVQITSTGGISVSNLNAVP